MYCIFYNIIYMYLEIILISASPSSTGPTLVVTPSKKEPEMTLGNSSSPSERNQTGGNNCGLKKLLIRLIQAFR